MVAQTKDLTRRLESARVIYMDITSTTQQFITRDIWDTISDEQKDINAKRHNRSTSGVEACKLCNRTISDKVLDKSWFVHMTVDGALVANGVETNDSQGYFPVGSDCAKKIPANFRQKFEN